MPRLMTFIPCEKYIENKFDNSVSMVGLFDQIKIPLPEGQEIPIATFVPWQWYINTVWYQESNDEDSKFEQRTYLVLPDGQEIGESITEFQITGRTHRILSSFEGFPVGQQGEYWLRLSLREVGTDQVWQEIAEFPIEVVHVVQPVATDGTGTTEE